MNRLLSVETTPLDQCTTGLYDGSPLGGWSSGPPDVEVRMTIQLDAYNFARFQRAMAVFFGDFTERTEQPLLDVANITTPEVAQKLLPCGDGR